MNARCAVSPSRHHSPSRPTRFPWYGPPVAARASILAALIIAAPLLAAQFELPRQSFLIDDVGPIVVAGLPPGEAVTIRLHGGAQDAWSSSETFTADANGVVNVPDPMRLFWSAQRDRSIRRPPPTSPRPSIQNPPEMWQLSAEVKG